MTAGMWVAVLFLAVPLVVFVTLPPNRVSDRMYLSLFCLAIAGGLTILDVLWRAT